MSIGKWKEIKFLPPGMIALNRELATGFHPKLEARLANHPVQEWEIKFAECATYLGMLLDDIYVQEDFNRLGFIMVEKLIPMREMPNTEIISWQ